MTNFSEDNTRTKVFMHLEEGVHSEAAASRIYTEIPNARVIDYSTDANSLIDSCTIEISQYNAGWEIKGITDPYPTALLPFEFNDTDVVSLFRQKNCKVFYSQGDNEPVGVTKGVNPYRLLHNGYTNAANLSYDQEGSTLRIISRLESQNWVTYKSDVVEYVQAYESAAPGFDPGDLYATNASGDRYGYEVYLNNREFVLNPTFDGKPVGNLLDFGKWVFGGESCYLAPYYLEPSNFYYYSRSIGRFWTVADVIQMCLFHMQFPRERLWKKKREDGSWDCTLATGSNSAQNYQSVIFPEWHEFSRLSPLMRSPEIVRDFRFKLGDRWVDVLNRVLKPNNLMLSYDYSAMPELTDIDGGSPLKDDWQFDAVKERNNLYKPKLKITNRASTSTINLGHQAKGSDIDPSNSVVLNFDLNYDQSRNNFNTIMAVPGPESVEFTAELVPGWDTKFDSLYTNASDKKLKLGSKEMEEAGSHFAWRRWVLNENADHLATRYKKPLMSGFPWQEVSFADLDGISGICAGAYADDTAFFRRLKFEPILLTHKDGGGIVGPHHGTLIEWHNGDGNWKNISGGTDPNDKYDALLMGRGVKLLDNECGILFTGDLPPSAILREGMEAGDTLNTAAKIRITATVTFPRGRIHTTFPSSGVRDPINYYNAYWNQAINVPNTRNTDYDSTTGSESSERHEDNYFSSFYSNVKCIQAERYVTRGRCVSGIYKSVYSDFDPELFTDLSIGRRSDLDGYVKSLWDAHFGAHGSGRATVKGIYTDYHPIGQSLEKLRGMELGLNLTDKAHLAGAKYPVITAMRLDFLRGETKLTFGDSRERLK